LEKVCKRVAIFQFLGQIIEIKLSIYTVLCYFLVVAYQRTRIIQMAIITKYVVEHKGVEKLVTTDKKEADKYDKMLDIADSLAVYIEAKGVKMKSDELETLTIILSRNKDALAKLFRGTKAEEVLAEEEKNVVDMDSRQAS
jgi:dsDNA-binding SOS-regulon protein